MILMTFTLFFIDFIGKFVYYCVNDLFLLICIAVIIEYHSEKLLLCLI